MKPLFLTLHTRRKLMILPDTLAHLDGHAVITKTYSIFKDSGFTTPKTLNNKLSGELLEPLNDPDYLGILKFDIPGKLFTYTSGKAGLETDEIMELIEHLSEVRDNPAAWR